MLPHLVAASTPQSGVFTAAQARAAGYTDTERRAHLKSGRWAGLRRGIYADRATVDAAAGDPYARHLLEVRACLLALGRQAVVSHTSACVVHGLGLVAGPSLDVTLTALDGGTHRGERLNVHACEVRPDEVTARADVAVTDLARSTLDVARQLSFREAVPLADQVLRLDPDLQQRFPELLHRYYSWPGIAAASRVIAFADPRSESVGESLSRVYFAEVDLPLPDLQVDFFDDRGLIGRTDFYWRLHRTIGEFDGRIKYREARDLYAEKRREDRLRVHDEVVRFSMADITRDRARLRSRLVAAFGRGAKRPPAPRRAPWWP